MDLRVQKGLSQGALGKRVGKSKSQISRIESGATDLTVEMAFRIAAALEVSVSEVIGLDEAVRSDVIEVTPPPKSDIGRLAARPDLLIYKVLTHALDDQGVKPDDLIVVEIAKPDTAPEPLTKFVLTLHDHKDPKKFATVIRQFVPPAQFVTNSKSESWPPINRAHENVRIVGAILFSTTPHT